MEIKCPCCDSVQNIHISNVCWVRVLDKRECSECGVTFFCDDGEPIDLSIEFDEKKDQPCST